MGKEILTFGEIEIWRKKFCGNESPVFKKDVDIEKVLVSNKMSSGKKIYNYFISYLHDDYKVILLHIMLPKESACVKSYSVFFKWRWWLIRKM